MVRIEDITNYQYLQLLVARKHFPILLGIVLYDWFLRVQAVS